MNPAPPPSLLPTALPPAPAPAGGGGERGDDDGLGRDLSVAPGPGYERDTLLVSPLETDAPGQKSANTLSDNSTTSWSSEADVEQPPQLPHQARHRDFSRVNDSLPSAHWDPLSDQRWKPTVCRVQSALFKNSFRHKYGAAEECMLPFGYFSVKKCH